jgi:hypothetical protein
VDVTEPGVKLIHGKAPYKALEEFQPCEMSGELLRSFSVLSRAEEKAAATALARKA